MLLLGKHGNQSSHLILNLILNVVVVRPLFLYQKITVNADNVVVVVIEDSLVDQGYFAPLRRK